MNRAAGRLELTRFIGVVEERNRLSRFYGDDVFEAFQERQRSRNVIGDALQRYPACAPFHPCGKELSRDPAAGMSCNLPCQFQRAPPRGAACHDQERGFSRTQHAGRVLKPG